MTKLEYISKNCMQCAKDLDECHGLVLELQEFVSKITDNFFDHEFTESGLNILLPGDLSPRIPPKVVASLSVTDISHPSGEGLVITFGEYSRFIPRCDFNKTSLEEIFAEIRCMLKAKYHKQVNVAPYIIVFFSALLIGWFLGNI